MSDLIGDLLLIVAIGGAVLVLAWLLLRRTT